MASATGARRRHLGAQARASWVAVGQVIDVMTIEAGLPAVVASVA
jgi:hypothetical protein